MFFFQYKTSPPPVPSASSLLSIFGIRLAFVRMWGSGWVSKKTLTDKDVISLQVLGLQVNGVNYVQQLELVGV